MNVRIPAGEPQLWAQSTDRNGSIRVNHAPALSGGTTDPQQPFTAPSSKVDATARSDIFAFAAEESPSESPFELARSFGLLPMPLAHVLLSPLAGKVRAWDDCIELK